ncbi:MAG TPA: HAMP domain-containing sensor histidine kinase [Nitrososphaera sp.]|nr:HAMP domain-containing sensor histidine kinase [Nitrososphaera sp.]
MAKGNLDQEIYRGRIQGRSLKGDELSQLVVAFESIRRRLVYLNDNLNKVSREKTVEVQRTLDQLAEKENALQRANAILTGRSEELKSTNEGLKARNRELSDAYDRLEKLDSMKGDFLMIAAHELRTPIQPIIGFVELAERGSISFEQAFKVISTEARRLASLSADVLDVSRIESGTLTYEMTPISLKQIADGLSTSSSKFATQDGIVTIKTQFDSDVKVLGDRKRLIQALENIVNNAVKFAKNGTIQIQTVNDFANNVVTITITDDGPGIPADILPVLFNKFVTRTEANQRGSGLGLFITKSIIEAHRGKIIAENNTSSEAKGARFTISLPIHDPSIVSATGSDAHSAASVTSNSIAS